VNGERLALGRILRPTFGDNERVAVRARSGSSDATAPRFDGVTAVTRISRIRLRSATSSLSTDRAP